MSPIRISEMIKGGQKLVVNGFSDSSSIVKIIACKYNLKYLFPVLNVAYIPCESVWKRIGTASISLVLWHWTCSPKHLMAKFKERKKKMHKYPQSNQNVLSRMINFYACWRKFSSSAENLLLYTTNCSIVITTHTSSNFKMAVIH